MVKPKLNSDADNSQRELPAAAKRALNEAELRREIAEESQSRPKETGGRDGPEPVRFGDWEVKGIASDF